MMTNPAPGEARNVHLLGQRAGNVKTLLGFRKGFHKIPAALPDAGFERQFAAICEPDLQQFAVDLFEKLRAARGYKRRGDQPSRRHARCDGGRRPDFTLDIGYVLDPADPGGFQFIHDLHTIRDIAVFADGSLNEVFSGVFSRVSVSFGAPIEMETLIDELEEAPGGAAALRYPPDCRECHIQLSGLAGEVRVTPRELEVGEPLWNVARGIGQELCGCNQRARGESHAAAAAPEARVVG